jgi:maltooligosyltrehalose trehalohydrolase
MPVAQETIGPQSFSRRLPVGAEILPEGGVHFRVWAPDRKKVEVFLEQEDQSSEREKICCELQSEQSGYFSARVPEATAGTLYQFRLDEDPQPYPDPASRFQPRGPHGPSEVIDPTEFEWTDGVWKGVGVEGQVLYEMHIGTFTQEGSWDAALRELAELADTGITVLEIMPLADFPGRFGWGYDGVNLFAPMRLYGRPEAFRRFVNRAHEVGLGVILDVVYNHLGPDGNYLWQYARDYFSTRYECEWGDALNFDGPNSGPVREYFLANVAYWIQEFHLDGFRIDATQQIFDSSDEHILAAITRKVREAGHPRSILVVGENEPQKAVNFLPYDKGGYDIDTMWNDDFHHSAMVAMTGRADAYYSDYRGTPQEFIAAIKWGYLYQGQWYAWQKQPRGTPALDLPPWKFVNFLQNHDQLANSGSGKRAHLLTSPSRYRAITAVFLLAPQTPMLFQGQEFAASSPFFYFVDQKDEIARLVAKGRAQFLSQFRVLATPEMQARLPDPADPMTFVRSKLDQNQRRSHAEEYALHRDLLRIRREDQTFRTQRHGAVDGAVVGAEAFVLRFFGENPGDDRLLVVNLGRDLFLEPAPEPLLAPPDGASWSVMWASEDPRYGGWGMPSWPTKGNWHLQGETALVLRPKP